MFTNHEPMRESHLLGADTQEWIIAPSPELAEAGILMAGVSRAGCEFQFVRLNAIHPQILVCLSGCGTVWIGNKWQPCGAGSAYVTPAGATHGYHTVGGELWKLAWVLFLPNLKCPISTQAPKLVKLDPRPFHAIIRGMHCESASHATKMMIKAWVHLLRLYVERTFHQLGSGDTLWPVWNSVAGDLSRPWTLDEMARLVSISPEHLRRLCRVQLGRTPMDHVMHLRMQQASTLLTTTSKKIELVAESIGYANRFAFSNAFRRHFGTTPAAYRRKHTIEV